MTINVYPEPSAGGTSLPPGASSVIFEGFASKGGITYTTTPINAGNILITVDSNSNSTYFIRAKDNVVTSINGTKNQAIISLSTTETSLAVRPINNYGRALTSASNRPFPLYKKSVTVNGVTYIPATVVNSSNVYQYAAIIATTDGVNWTTSVTWSSGEPDFNCGPVNNGSGLYFTRTRRSGSGEVNGGRVTTNFTNWTTVNVGTNDSLWIAGGNGRLIAYSNATTLYFSTNGTAFNIVTVATSLGSQDNADCAFNPKNNMFVAIGNRPFGFTNTVSVSTTGVNWTQTTVPGPSVNTGNVQAIAYGDGLFAIIAQSSTFVTNGNQILSISSNGTTWTQVITFTSSNNLGDTSINYGDGLFFINFGTNSLLSYNNFNTWVTSPFPTGYSIDPNKNEASVHVIPNGIIYNGQDSSYTTIDKSYIAAYELGSNTLN